VSQPGRRPRSAGGTRPLARSLGVCALVMVAVGPGAPPRPAEARDLWVDGERSVVLRTWLKSSVVISRFADDRQLFPVREGGESLWRVRLEPEWRFSRAGKLAVTYEHRMRLAPSAGGSPPIAGALPLESPAPYRLRPLDRAVITEPGFSWRHEIDRGYLALHRAGAEITIGRQAVGWGRGVLFGAVDLFSPFSPLEADREWRRGVDALRADVRLRERLSLDAVAALGETIDGSAFATRLRGYVGEVDGELVLGWRARDRMVGVTSSAVAGEAELHGEVAWFHTSDALPGGTRDAVKAVVGGSYRLGLGPGVPVFVEYHYSDFGVARAGEVDDAFADPAWRERYVRGDTQILGRHAAAVLAHCELSPEWTLSGTMLLSPTDGSGVVTPGASLRLGDRIAVHATAYLPFGARPSDGSLRSEYGATPIAGFLQVSVYD